MDRIQIAAIGLALVAFALYYATMPAPRVRHDAPAEMARQAQEAAPQTGPSATPSGAVPSPGDAPVPVSQGSRQIAELFNDAVRVRVSNAPLRVIGIELPGFPDRKGRGAEPMELVTNPDRGSLRILLGDEALAPLERAPWQIEQRGSREIELRTSEGQVEVAQRLELDADGYGAKLRLAIRNRSAETVRPRPQLLFHGEDSPDSAPEHFMKLSLVWDRGGSVGREPIASIGSPGFFGGLFGGGGTGEKLIAGPVEMAGVDSQYFMLAAASDNPRETQVLTQPLGAHVGQLLLQYGATELPPGTSIERTWRLYMGPKIPALVRAVDPRFEILTDVGWHWVRPLVNLFAASLKWLHDHVVGNYGWAIIILTVLLRIATYPLSQRSMQSMKKFSAIAPEMKVLQDKYGSDRGKLQEEMMKLYREKGINPLSSLGGGCIPMLIQMPFMVALYFALQSSIELRHAPFLGWIDDLSAPEDLHLFGFPIRLLPLMMGASMLLQQRLTPSPTADPQQRQMMSLMSVMFVVLFYGFPSGLVLYWFVSNLLGIAQQLWVNRAQPSRA
jgi:YidC/Oxa1 family membrane protein insertase